MNEPKFPDGFRVFAPGERAPEYILGEVVINVEQFEQYMRANESGGEVRLTLKRSQNGKLYAQLNEWRPQQPRDTAQNRPTPPATRPAPPKPPAFPQSPQNPANRQPTPTPPPRAQEFDPGNEPLDEIPF